MSVYVDALKPTKRSKRWPFLFACHLLADDVDELHAMANRIGMRRAWFQPRSRPHYDLNPSRRAHAVRLGAIQLDAQGLKKWLRDRPRATAGESAR